MKKLVVSEFVTLDGVMEAPGGEPGHPHSGWVIKTVLRLVDSRAFGSGVMVNTYHRAAG